ncbi:mRNA cap guanine-N7 methyltransferase [Vanrija pseudolonga]|uniref:mRNA cap guanine-N(7) methyltransferase n=1 Tax=Vanrija pseudolonga TaxID=143232 RepID=A0AAF1BQS1_9TREE|nr:mRNA cap guanine-N7 methyltransferase [Vanrija pseudolonga]
MVYDPVRDCDIPSPAVSSRPPIWGSDPPNAPPPPAFHDRTSISSTPSNRPISRGGPGSLRGLLNDDAPSPTSRRGSEVTVSSIQDDDRDYHSGPSSSHSRPHLAKLLNEPAPPLVRSPSSGSVPSVHYDGSSPRMSAASTSLHPSALSAARTSVSASRSPLMSTTGLSSPASSSSALATDSYHAHPLAESLSRRASSSYDTRPMPPPAEPPIRSYDQYNTPVQHPSNLSSPGVSVSPRSQSVALPAAPAYSSSRPSSARSNSNPWQPPANTHSSPESTTRRLSDDPPAPRVPPSNGRRAVPPPPPSKPYRPLNPTRSRTILQPITDEEIQHLREIAQRHNILRSRGPWAAPSWSAPSPRDTVGDSFASGGRSGGPSRRGSEASAPENRPDNRLREQHESYGRPQGTKRSSEGDDDLRAASRPRTDTYQGNAAAVSSYYNSRQEVGVNQREFSPIIGLKKFNNWVKSVLIGKFVGGEGRRPGAKVLDIGCGKGGDLNKWKVARISLYVGMDIADVSVDQARERYNSLRGNRFEGYFKAHDCYARPISEALPERYKQRNLYDNVTMQFCMHYAFETASKARMMIENVSRYLRKGGIFIGTIPNTDLLLERLEQIPEGEPLEFGNSCYSITFEERHHKGIYGHAYHFYLEDAVEGVPEYTVDWDNFVSLAREYGLELTYKKTFNDILQEEQSTRDFGPLLGKMGVVNEHGESAMDSDQWEAANLYMGFAFTKV